MRHYTFDNATVRLAGTTAAREFFQPIFIERDRELLLVALCDEEVRLMQLLSLPGQEAYVQFSLPRIMRQAVCSRCAGVILAHNHPSGDTRPSRQDKSITDRVSLAADALGIILLDHIIFDGSPAFSFRERGLI